MSLVSWPQPSPHVRFGNRWRAWGQAGLHTSGFVVTLVAGLVRVTRGIWRTRGRSPSSDSSMPVYPVGGRFGVPDHWCFRNPPPHALCWVSTSHSVRAVEDSWAATAGASASALGAGSLTSHRRHSANKAALYYVVLHCIMLYYVFSCGFAIFLLIYYLPVLGSPLQQKHAWLSGTQ